MWYWIVMIILIAGSAGMLAVSFDSIKKNKALAAAGIGGRSRGRKDDYDEEDDYDEPPRRRRQEKAPEEPKRSAKKKRRQWKIILEDIDSWDKYSFTFYDSVGIGRGKDGSIYEKYLPITGDGRVSKMHCVIIHRGDKLYLKDEGSRNGTYLNGERIDRPVVIQRDDIIGLGETRLEVQKILRESAED
nr:FHA domain-containing protein [uncultured Mediterraneibacter sp.]